MGTAVVATRVRLVGTQTNAHIRGQSHHRKKGKAIPESGLRIPFQHFSKHRHEMRNSHAVAIHLKVQSTHLQECGVFRRPRRNSPQQREVLDYFLIPEAGRSSALWQFTREHGFIFLE